MNESKPETPLFDKDAPLDLESLRRDLEAKRDVPIFLENRFELFGPTVISRFV